MLDQARIGTNQLGSDSEGALGEPSEVSRRFVGSRQRRTIREEAYGASHKGGCRTDGKKMDCR
jgi:hypothetical protein